MKYIILILLFISPVIYANASMDLITASCESGIEEACQQLIQIQQMRAQQMQAISQALYNLSDGIQRAQQGPDMGPNQLQFQTSCQQFGSITRCR